MASYKDKITKNRVSNLEVGDKLWDTEIPGFYVYRQKTKTVFYYKYRIDGKQVLSKIGLFGSISAEDAKEVARTYYHLSQRGIDPVAFLKEKADKASAKTEKEQYTISDAYSHWEKYAKPKLKKSSLDEWTLYPRYVEPKFGHRTLLSITPEEVSEFHTSIEKPYSANRSIKIMKKLYKVARMAKKYDGDDPFIFVVLNKERKRRRHLTGEEPRKLYATLERYKLNGPEEFKARSCILLYLLTSARKREWLDSPKSWVDRDRRILSLPDTKNDEPDDKILPGAAIEILDDLFEMYPHSPWIFPSPKKVGRPLRDIKRHWKLIREAAEIEDVTLHDLRRTFASLALTEGFTLEQIGEILNHKNINTTKGYSYLDIAKKREATDQIAESIIKEMNSVPREPVEDRDASHDLSLDSAFPSVIEVSKLLYSNSSQ